jgi:DNA-binding transcriptional LysR family regulator
VTQASCSDRLEASGKRAVNLRQLRYFIVVAEELHFGRAAARLNIAQPPLSQQIRRLEQTLDVQLLHRTKRKVELTQAGRVFLEDARAILTQMERAQRRARRAGDGHVGHIVVGAIPTAGSLVFGRILPSFRDRCPEIEMAILNLSTMEQVAALRAQRIDVGFLRAPPSDASLTTKVIARERFVAVLPASHALAGFDAIPLGAMADEPQIMFPRHLAPDHFDLVVGLFNRIGRTVHVAQETEHMQTRLDLIAGGFGITLLPESLTTFHRDGVVYRPLLDVAVQVETVMATRRDDRSEVLATFVGIVDSVLADDARPASRMRD